MYTQHRVHLWCACTEAVQTVPEMQTASAITQTQRYIHGVSAADGPVPAARGRSVIIQKLMLWFLSGQQKAETPDLTMTNEAAKASTKSQAMRIGLPYPQKSSTQKLISLLAL